MQDYVKQGLMMRKAPIIIFQEINKMLQSKNLTKKERKELEKQLDKAKQLAGRTSAIFGCI